MPTINPDIMPYRSLQFILTVAFLTLLTAGGGVHYCLGRSIEAHIADQQALEQQHQALNDGFAPMIHNAFETGIVPTQVEFHARKMQHEQIVSNMIDNLTPAVAEQRWQSVITVALICILVIQITVQTLVHIRHRRRSARRGMMPA